MNLIEGLHEEMDRVRDVIKKYESLPNNAGFLAASFMRGSVKRAEELIASGDTVGMMRAYQDLKNYEL